MKQSISVSLSRANKTRERCNQEKILFSFKKENLDNQGVLGETDKTGVGTESPGCTEMVTRNRISYYLRSLISQLFMDFHFDWEVPGPAHNNSSTLTGLGSQSYKEALDCVTAHSWCSSSGLLWRTWWVFPELVCLYVQLMCSCQFWRSKWDESSCLYGMNSTKLAIRNIAMDTMIHCERCLSFYLLGCWAEYFSLSHASFVVPFRTLDISSDQTLGLARAVLYSATPDNLLECHKGQGRQGCVIKFLRVQELEALCLKCISVWN